MENNFTHLALLVGTSHPLFMLLSPGPFPQMDIVKYLRSYKLTKTFEIQGLHCGLLECNGSNHGMGNKTTYGKTCEFSPYHFLTINTLYFVSHPAPMLTSTCGSLENTKAMMHLYLFSSTQTGSEDIS